MDLALCQPKPAAAWAEHFVGYSLPLCKQKQSVSNAFRAPDRKDSLIVVDKSRSAMCKFIERESWQALLSP
ncbi:hypothetical protein [Stenotrophomonas sp.]|uniref:hypothetical protein n=1 Tax=Stenotrophomonas sp. TaxID=69392 RepID=UPI0028A9D6D1|nr:hypothetical protein [Stenotrophomonas sp.]